MIPVLLFVNLGQHGLPYYFLAPVAARIDCFLGKVMSNALDRLRTSHHRAAAMFAKGYSVSEIASEIGRSEKSIADLEVDPAFVSLVQHYRNQRKEPSNENQRNEDCYAVSE